MGNLDPTKIAIVLIVALVVLGPDKLPGFTKQVGAWWGEFQRIRARLQAEVNGAVSQINNAAAPLTDTFKAASLGASGLIPPIFTGDRGNPPKPVATQPDGADTRPKVPQKERGDQTRGGWGFDEEESGYSYGDPRLN